MPQTRFVLSKALECHLKPIIVVNKIDRPDARPHAVIDETLDLLIDLGADDDIADFPHLFTSAKEGYATHDPAVRTALHATAAGNGREGDSWARWSSRMNRCKCWSQHSIGPNTSVGSPWDGFGPVRSSRGQTVALMQADQVIRTKVSKVFVFENLGRKEVPRAEAGDVVALVGLEQVEIGDTVCDPEKLRPMPRLTVDEPTLEMVFSINSSPFAGRDGKYVTTRQLRERLFRELERNVALQVGRRTRERCVRRARSRCAAFGDSD